MSPRSLLFDPLLHRAPVCHGVKVLPPVALTGRLGEGNFGSVYLGHHLNLQIDVAVKCLKSEVVSDNPEYVRRFEREARIAAGSTHENLVRVYDTLHAAGLYYTVMEFVDGESIKRRVARVGAMSPRAALTVFIAGLKAVQALHARQVIHRDIKPPNLLVSRDGTVKLADLGIAKSGQQIDTLMTMPSTIMGTPRYMAPEQFEESSVVNPRTDLYSLGATLAYMLIGRHGITGKTPPEVMHNVCQNGFPDLRRFNADLPEDVCALVDDCTAIRAGDRPHEAELLRRAQRVLHGLGGPTSLRDPEAYNDHAGTRADRQLEGSRLHEIRQAMANLSAQGSGDTEDEDDDTLRRDTPGGSAPGASLGPRMRLHRWWRRSVVPLVVLIIAAAALATLWRPGPTTGSTGASGTDTPTQVATADLVRGARSAADHGQWHELMKSLDQLLQRVPGRLPQRDFSRLADQTLAAFRAAWPDRAVRDKTFPDLAQKLVSIADSGGSPVASLLWIEASLHYDDSQEHLLGLIDPRREATFRKAVYLGARAIKTGHPPAAIYRYLGDIYLMFPPLADRERAVGLYREGATAGDSAATARLGKILLGVGTLEDATSGVKKLYQAATTMQPVSGFAAYWYAAALQSSAALAHTQAGHMHGQSVSRYTRRYYVKAARLGYQPARDLCRKRGYRWQTKPTTPER